MITTKVKTIRCHFVDSIFKFFLEVAITIAETEKEFAFRTSLLNLIFLKAAWWHAGTHLMRPFLGIQNQLQISWKIPVSRRITLI